jgi:hypothetical protein
MTVRGLGLVGGPPPDGGLPPGSWCEGCGRPAVFWLSGRVPGRVRLAQPAQPHEFPSGLHRRPAAWPG